MCMLVVLYHYSAVITADLGKLAKWGAAPLFMRNDT